MAITNLTPRRIPRQSARLAPAIFVALLAVLLLFGAALMAQEPQEFPTGDLERVCSQLKTAKELGSDPNKVGQFTRAIDKLRLALKDAGIEVEYPKVMSEAESICKEQ